MKNYLQNKYATWYFALVSSRQNRILTEEYKERHHIIPRSLGGLDAAENLVDLTAREHYIAHLLLVKMFEGESKMKMSFALRCMSNFQNKYHNRYTPASKIYALAKREAIAAHKQKTAGHPGYLKKQTPEARKRISNTMKEVLSQLTPAEKAQRIKNSCSSDESWTKERKEKISKALTGKTIPDNVRKKMSLAKQNQTQEQKLKCGDSNRGKTWKLVDGKRVWFNKEK
ncbi:MAG TPA: HNH endonuclease signature motif containing protein [Methanosarcina sp.]|nr:HNH endonuclease signature motif containing protein [Methanosarcina sp.]